MINSTSHTATGLTHVSAAIVGTNGPHSPENRGTVLVVDDERLNRAILCKLLKQHGFDTAQASNGVEAIEAIRSQDFVLVLLDISMPEKDGFEVLHAIRVEDRELELPIIMVTANDESKEIVRAFESGANDYVTKPVDIGVTLARINMHLQFQQSRAALKKSEERYALVAEGTNDGVWDWDLQTGDVYYSQRWLSIFDVEPDHDSTIDVWFSRIHPEDRPRVENEIESHRTQQTPCFEAEMRMRHRSGNFRWTLCRGLAVWGPDGNAIRMAGSLTDITEGKVADALTGLPNRVLFRERLDRCFLRKVRSPEFDFALLYLDLDNFKLVNDSLGHESGDRLLVAIARRLESSLRESESFVCRLGGDEFSILIEGVNSVEEPKQVADRIISSVSSPISLGGGREVFASVSVGVSFSKDDFKDADAMIQAADTAMYRAKEQGKSCYRIFDPAMRLDAKKRLNLENELRHAVERRGLHLHYQPIVDLNTSQISGFEALARWNHREFGVISPAEFVPVAEETGLIVELGKQVIQDACRQLAQWRQESPLFQTMGLSVNISSIQLRDQKLVDSILRILETAGLPPEVLRVEVTESCIMENPACGAATLSGLRAHGVKVAIDDFGTGYSSLAYIHQLAPDVVKIDRSFVDKINCSTDKATIVGAILAMAEGLSLDVVAEGIETHSQRDLLREMGCDFGQGFLFARPLTPDQLFKTVLNGVGLGGNTPG